MDRQKGLIILGGCGVLFLLCAVIIYLVNPIKMAMRLAGFEAEGQTEVFLAEHAVAQQQTPIDWSGLGGIGLVQTGEGSVGPVQIVPETISPVNRVTLNVQGQQAVIDTQTIHADRVEQAQTVQGTEAYYAEYNETGANALANDLFVQYATADLQQQMRNPHVDLKPGAMVVYAEANLEIGWQEVALILAFDESGTQFEVAGIDIGGQRFDQPPAGFLANMMNSFEVQGNQALRNAQIVTPTGNLNIQQIYITENTLQVVAH